MAKDTEVGSSMSSTTRLANNLLLSVAMAETIEVDIGGGDKQTKKLSKSPVNSAFKAPIELPFYQIAVVIKYDEAVSGG